MGATGARNIVDLAVREGNIEGMNFDISHLLEQWEYQPGQVVVRRFVGKDGAFQRMGVTCQYRGVATMGKCVAALAIVLSLCVGLL